MKVRFTTPAGIGLPSFFIDAENYNDKFIIESFLTYPNRFAEKKRLWNHGKSGKSYHFGWVGESHFVGTENSILKDKIIELEKELKVTEHLLKESNRVINEIPKNEGCEHCIPCAINWIKSKK